MVYTLDKVLNISTYTVYGQKKRRLTRSKTRLTPRWPKSSCSFFRTRRRKFWVGNSKEIVLLPEHGFVQIEWLSLRVCLFDLYILFLYNFYNVSLFTTRVKKLHRHLTSGGEKNQSNRFNITHDTVWCDKCVEFFLWYHSSAWRDTLQSVQAIRINDLHWCFFDLGNIW